MTPTINPGIEITEGIISAQTKVIDDTGTEHQAKASLDGVQRVNARFESGAVYENEFTASDDLKHSFEAASLLLHDVVIQISTNAALFGSTTNQRFERAAGSTYGFTKLDVSTFYFKNKTAGQNTKINIIGTRV